jgi:flagellar protein FliO/FliZ
MEIDSVSYLKFFFALLFVIGLIGGFALIAKKIGMGNRGPTSRGRGNRLSIIESMPVDAKRRVVLIRCDNKDYMLLLGGVTELLIEDKLPVDFTQKTNQRTPVASKIMNKFQSHIGIRNND